MISVLKRNFRSEIKPLNSISKNNKLFSPFVFSAYKWEAKIQGSNDSSSKISSRLYLKIWLSDAQ